MTQNSEDAADLPAVFGRPFGVLISDDALQTALRLVTSLATETTPGSLGSGVTMTVHGAVATTAASLPLVEAVDRLQYDLDEGPCLDAWRLMRLVRVDDLRTERRWPAWTAAARPLGIRSVLSVPLQARDERIGALKVYAPQPSLFGDREERVLGMFAEQAVGLLAAVRTPEELARVNDQLKEAVRTRDLI